MLFKINKIIRNNRGVINTVEILGLVAAVSIILVAVVTAIKPTIIGTDSILTNSSSRVEDLDDIMTP